MPTATGAPTVGAVAQVAVAQVAAAPHATPLASMQANNDNMYDPTNLMSNFKTPPIKTYLKLIFAEFRRRGIMMQQRDFKNFPNSYRDDWNVRFENAAEHRSDYGSAPNRPRWDPDENRKLRDNANPPWNLNQYVEAVGRRRLPREIDQLERQRSGYHRG